jgi:hypothetical protein
MNFDEWWNKDGKRMEQTNFFTTRGLAHCAWDAALKAAESKQASESKDSLTTLSKQ